MSADRITARHLRRLSGQICTPPGFPTAELAKIKEQRLAVFHEWPSGHWSITDHGRDFLAEHGGE